jgi:ubiquinone/menaquinone biosynthesis C-methylase UbiE
MDINYADRRKDRFFKKLMSHFNHVGAADPEASVLVIGGLESDYRLLSRAGFRNIIVSNIEEIYLDNTTNSSDHKTIALDAEDLSLPDQSYDIVFAYEVLHHCRSPHRALCEMVRVAKHAVIFCEPNDSFLMRLLINLRLSFPYEIPAVIDNDFKKGGVRDSCIPNYIYRFNKNEVVKVISSYLAEYQTEIFAYSYWDLIIDENEIVLRKQTKIGAISKVIGTHRFIKILNSLAVILNYLPLIGEQGNKMLCLIPKTYKLKPWLIKESDDVQFNKNY